MSGTQHTSIEEHVMSSARGLLYGHPLAWESPGRGRTPAGAARHPRRSRLIAFLAPRRETSGNGTPVAAQTGGC